MNKQQAIEIFGSAHNLYQQTNMTRQSFFHYEDDLPEKLKQRVVGAAVINGYYVPKKFIHSKLILSVNY